MAETSLERRKRLAAEQDDFQAWQAAYRAENALKNGGGLINGVPSAQVVGTPAYLERANPILPAPGNRTVANPDLVAANAERLSAQAKERNDTFNATQAQRARSFMADMGEDPDMIGLSTLTTTPSGQRIMNVPSLRQQQEAQSLVNKNAGLDARARIAANDARRRGRSDVWASALNDLTLRGVGRGGNALETQQRYWLDRLGGPAPISQWTSNGFATPPPVSDYVRSQLY